MSDIFTTVERILTADTDDLRELAAIAGMDPRIMFIRADLSGVDLRRQEIDFLFGLAASFDGAELTSQQRSALERDRRKTLRTAARRRNIGALRVEATRRFIEQCFQYDLKTRSGRSVSAVLEGALREPLISRLDYLPEAQCSDEYVEDCLNALALEDFLSNRSFVEGLFEFFSSIGINGSTRAASIIENCLRTHYSDEERASFFLLATPPDRLAEAWATHPNLRDVRNFRIQFLAQRMKVSQELGKHLLSHLEKVHDIIHFLVDTKLDFDRNFSERLSYIILSNNDEYGEIANILDAIVGRNLRSALVRQVLAASDTYRINQVVRWLDRQPGGLGGLAISDAILATHDFDAALGIARNVGSKLGSAQKASMLSALRSLARSDADEVRLRRLL